ncbi:hypothetical protein [Massilia sp. Se16.2.3]|uniref:hypothetical protein n=1 Tax=Massilia sp. Se16.2.3 TaxID=2709303 RepID=UPI001E335EA4|nr:hypothetical protein [Massilia sp. Se16.2.3]
MHRPAQFEGALRAPGPAIAATSAPEPKAASFPTQAAPGASPNDSLLLRDATLEDIVRHLHARGIEPTFRHLLPLESVRH